jgi:hypothetical protein
LIIGEVEGILAFKPWSPLFGRSISSPEVGGVIWGIIPCILGSSVIIGGSIIISLMGVESIVSLFVLIFFSG